MTTCFGGFARWDHPQTIFIVSASAPVFKIKLNVFGHFDPNFFSCSYIEISNFPGALTDALATIQAMLSSGAVLAELSFIYF